VSECNVLAWNRRGYGCASRKHAVRQCCKQTARGSAHASGKRRLRSAGGRVCALWDRSTAPAADPESLVTAPWLLHRSAGPLPSRPHRPACCPAAAPTPAAGTAPRTPPPGNKMHVSKRIHSKSRIVQVRITGAGRDGRGAAAAPHASRWCCLQTSSPWRSLQLDGLFFCGNERRPRLHGKHTWSLCCSIHSSPSTVSASLPSTVFTM